MKSAESTTRVIKPLETSSGILSCVIEKTIRRGVECTTCHTVYFIEHPANRDRLYYASPRDLEVKLQNPRTPLYDLSDLYTRKTAKNPGFWTLLLRNANLWTLLCVCSQQISFEKTQLKWYATPHAAFERGHAIEGEWKTVDGPVGWALEHRVDSF